MSSKEKQSRLCEQSDCRIVHLLFFSRLQNNTSLQSGSQVEDKSCSSTSATDSRIINLGQLNLYLNNIAAHAATCTPYQDKIDSFPNDMMLIMEQARYGMASIIAYQCCGCNEQISFATSTKVTSPEGNKYWSCNLAAVWGQMATGGGFNKLEESMSILGLPVMSKKLFVNTEKLIGKWWWNLLGESIQAAGKAERELAIHQGSFHHGVLAITVIVDAGWSKRTHKHTYNALSGVGVIFGQQTGKLLYVGVRNKFCAACATGKEHTCFKNWKEASSSMETDIILAGFKAAETQHGVRYINFIGDGDSSVYPTLVAGVPGWGYAITKKECANHALKCYRGSLEQLVKDKPQYKGKHKLTAAMRLRLTVAARCAVIMRSKEDDKRIAASLLQADIMNGPMHCFGNHHKCRPEYCKVVRSKCNKKTTNSPDELAFNTASTPPKESNSSNEENTSSNSILDHSLTPTSSLVISPNLTPNSSFASNSCSSQNSSLALTPSVSQGSDTSSVDAQCDDHDSEVEGESLDEFLREQQQAWEDATTTETDQSLDPVYHIDEEMLCDIKAIASRLASKAQQLLGN